MLILDKFLRHVIDFFIFISENYMKAWLLKDFGLENLQLGEIATPTPKAGELLVKVGAVSLNYRDKAIVDGIYEPHLVPKPLIPVSDAVGTVVSVGDGVSRFKIGDRVNSHFYSRWLDGAPGPDRIGTRHGRGVHLCRTNCRCPRRQGDCHFQQRRQSGKSESARSQ